MKNFRLVSLGATLAVVLTLSACSSVTNFLDNFNSAPSKASGLQMVPSGSPASTPGHQTGSPEIPSGYIVNQRRPQLQLGGEAPTQKQQSAVTTGAVTKMAPPLRLVPTN